MSDYSSVAPPQNNSQTAAFAAAVQRARLIAAKIDGGGNKRPLEDGQEPSAKKLAGLDSGYQSPPGAMSGGVVGGGGRPGAVPPGQQMLPDHVNEHIRVPDKMVGLIIGRGGEQISRLQSESGCKIQMAPDSGGQPERMCMLTGTREAVAVAKEMVNAIVNQRGRDGGPPDGGPPQQRMGGPPGGGQNFEEIMVPGPKVGLIIGKGGETIKQLQEKSGAKMVIIQDGPNPEFEKPLRITGDPQKVEYAKQLVYELIAEKEMQYSGGGGGGRGGGGKQGGGGNQWGGPGSGDDFDQQSMPDGHEVLVPQAAVGVVIGKGGDMIKKIQAETGARVQFHQGRDEGPGDRRCFLQGKPQQVEQAREMIAGLIDSVNRRDQDTGRGGPGGPRRPNQRNGDGGPPGGYGGNWGGPPQDNKIEVSFSVSNVKCGVIIGRGGEVIKQINAQSGAHCELDRRTQVTRGNRTFIIRGDPDSVETARRLIQEKVGMPLNFVVESGGGGGGGSNGGSGGGSGEYGGGYGGPGGPGGGPPGPAAAPGWGYNPHWHPAAQQQQQHQQQDQQQQVPVNPSTGQPDYSQQWIDYYRSMGLTREAEAIEQQSKASKSAATTPQPAAHHPQGGGVSAANGAAAGGAGAVAAGSQPDYSAQWAEYYRSLGKVKEAEAIEAQMKQKVMAGAAVTSAAPTSGYPGTGAGGYQPQAYGGQPGQPQPQQQQPQYGGYAPYHQQHAAVAAAAAAYAQQEQPQ